MRRPGFRSMGMPVTTAGPRTYGGSKMPPSSVPVGRMGPRRRVTVAGRAPLRGRPVYGPISSTGVMNRGAPMMAPPLKTYKKGTSPTYDALVADKSKGMLGSLLKSKKGLAIGGGALALTMYEMGKNRSSARNGIQPGSSGGGMGY